MFGLWFIVCAVEKARKITSHIPSKPNVEITGKHQVKIISQLKSLKYKKELCSSFTWQRQTGNVLHQFST